MPIELFDYQRSAVNRLKSGKVLRGDVGSGKSFTSLFFYIEKFSDRDLYIITTASKRNKGEWQNDCETLNIKSVVDSWNNIEKYSDVKNAFFIFDEQRAVGYGTWGKNFVKIAKQNKWIMLSATPGDVYIDYLPLFLANNFYKNKTDFTKQHVEYNPHTPFPQIKRYHNIHKLDQMINHITVKMDDVRTTKKHESRYNCDYDRELYNKVTKERWNPYTEEPIQNASEYCQVLRRIVNGSERRQEEAKDHIRINKKIIVFYNFTYELEILRSLCESINKPYSEYNGQKHQPIPDTDEWAYLVQYTAGAEGWNCILTDTILFYSLNYSYRIMHQSKGRIDRVNTPFSDLYYITLKSDSQIDNSIQDSINRKKKFNEKSFYGL